MFIDDHRRVMQTIIGGACFNAGFTNRGTAQVVRCVSHLLSGYLDEGDVDLGGAYPGYS